MAPLGFWVLRRPGRLLSVKSLPGAAAASMVPGSCLEATKGV